MQPWSNFRDHCHVHSWNGRSRDCLGYRCYCWCWIGWLVALSFLRTERLPVQLSRSFSACTNRHAGKFRLSSHQSLFVTPFQSFITPSIAKLKKKTTVIKIHNGRCTPMPRSTLVHSSIKCKKQRSYMNHDRTGHSLTSTRRTDVSIIDFMFCNINIYTCIAELMVVIKSVMPSRRPRVSNRRSNLAM